MEIRNLGFAGGGSFGFGWWRCVGMVWGEGEGLVVGEKGGWGGWMCV